SSIITLLMKQHQTIGSDSKLRQMLREACRLALARRQKGKELWHRTRKICCIDQSPRLVFGAREGFCVDVGLLMSDAVWKSGTRQRSYKSDPIIRRHRLVNRLHEKSPMFSPILLHCLPMEYAAYKAELPRVVGDSVVRTGFPRWWCDESK